MIDKIKKAIGKIWNKIKSLFIPKKAIMIGGCYGLQVHSNTYNSVMYTSVLCKAITTVES